MPSSSAAPSAKTCDLCGHTEFDAIADRDRRGLPLDTCVCRHCGLVAHADIPTEEELHRYYTVRYRQDYHHEMLPSPRRVMRAWNNAERVFGRLAEHLQGDERVLDIGTGIGCTAKRFEQAGFRTVGIDPGAEFLQYSRDSLHAPVERRVLFDLPRRPAWDAVVLIHVIEHFRSPRAALEHIHSLMRPGGWLYVECPNLAGPFAPPSRRFHQAHIHNFTPETLTMLAARCGFRLEKQYNSTDDTDLQMLFVHAKPRAHVNPESYFRTLRALDKFDWLGYHLRLKYLTERLSKVAGYLREHVMAGRFVRQLEERCRRDAERPASHPLRRAA